MRPAQIAEAADLDCLMIEFELRAARANLISGIGFHPMLADPPVHAQGDLVRYRAVADDLIAAVCGHVRPLCLERIMRIGIAKSIRRRIKIQKIVAALQQLCYIYASSWGLSTGPRQPKSRLGRLGGQHWLNIGHTVPWRGQGEAF